ncbi:MAG: hypothetical protein KAY82_03500 [Hylemonella sp.]|nr:hypothetical protein [Hylemonella sp.]
MTYRIWLALSLSLTTLMGCGGVGPSVIRPQNEIGILNPSFDQVAPDGALTAWRASEHNVGQSYTFTADTVGAWSAPSSAKINRHGDEEFGLLSQQIQFQPAWGNKTLRLSAQLKSEGVSGGGGALVLQMNAGGGQILAWNHMNSARLMGTRDWKKYSIDLKALPGTYSIKVGVMLEGAGTVWADDIKLEMIN